MIKYRSYPNLEFTAEVQMESSATRVYRGKELLGSIVKKSTHRISGVSTYVVYRNIKGAMVPVAECMNLGPCVKVLAGDNV